MDCNKEEALRAKQIAEKKMENKDFSGALKIALKAQQLYPDLENVSQMILVCEVHCSAEKKSYGIDKDWYGILKIEPSADDLSIKKQYRKLALVLHPDKNKFAGSTDAFKLIGEAQRVLLDREKRMMHDSKRKTFGNIPTQNWFPRQPSRQSNAHQHPWTQGSHSVNSQFQNNFTAGHSVNSHFPQPRAQTGASQNRLTFWTVCPFCSVRYQFYKEDVLNKVILCQSCKKSFTAYEFNAYGATPGTNQSQPSVHKFPFKGAESTTRNYTTKPVFEGNNGPSKRPPKAQGNVNRKRKKKVDESSESSDSEDSSESDEAIEVPSESSDKENGSESDEDVVIKDNYWYQANKDFQHFGEQPRRSSRPKRNISYKENLADNDDDITLPNKTTKSKSSSSAAEPKFEDTLAKEDPREFKANDNKGGGTEKEDEEEPSLEPEVYNCPDPDFSDFDKDRKEESFRQGQIWAVYDDSDAMPRYYAFVRKVLLPGFKLQITWLEPLPGNDEDTEWVENGLPVSCGMFKRGKSENAEDLPMFSHLVSWDKGVRRETYRIYPQKGETWAVFKNWTMKWCFSTQDGTRNYEYEFVEILSEYDEDDGVSVSYLEKVKGFTCLFSRIYDRVTIIPPSEKLRFSHMVPSCRMTGQEREGVPKGCYELDPAALPASTFEQVTL